MDLLRPNLTKWVEQDKYELDRNKVDRMDQIEPKWTKQDQSGQNELNKTNVDQIG